MHLRRRLHSLFVFEIGSSLREARTRQGFDFTEMEFRTKVRAKYLRALEAEQFEQLPGHTYIKGFLRTYAESLGLDGQLYVDEYNSRYVAGEEERPLRPRRVPPPPRRQRHQRESRLVVVAVTAMILLTALVIAAWKFGDTAEPKVQGVNVSARESASALSRGVSITATRGASFMEVQSPGGSALYRGTLERGQVKRFARQKLTITLSSPKNVVVRVAGTPMKVPSSGRLTIPRGS
jgi:cytoskeletal protein RodZ